jgi:hypothetical protein
MNLFRTIAVVLAVAAGWISAVNSEVHAASDKPYLNVLGEALAFHEGADDFLDRCSNMPNGSVKMGSKEFFWNAQEAARVARNIVSRTQACIDWMYPKALKLGWMSRSEWELGIRRSESTNKSAAKRFENYLIKNGVKSHDIGKGVCVMIKMNLVNIAKDTFCYPQ